MRPSIRAHSQSAIAAVLIACLAACALVAREGTIAYLAVTSGTKDITVHIHRSFIERYKNRVTIDAMMTVDRVMPEPFPPSLDGDLHFSGRSPQVGLPLVAEISNAKAHKDAMEAAHRAGGSGTPIRIAGVWRIWPEHAIGTETQGDSSGPYRMANPSHVFEIHPVTRLSGIELLDSFVPVDGFKPGDAERTIPIYQKASCTLRVNRDTVSIMTPAGLYNDVEFIMELVDDQQVVDDGRFVNAAVHDMKGGLLVNSVRMVFAAGTPPEIAVRRLRRGDRLHVFGMPRLDLAEVSRRVSASQSNPGLLTGTIPYEIIVLGVYGE